jgi:uncharacterized protein (TIGR03067 family)
MRTHLLLVVVAVCLVAAREPKQDGKDELAKLNGTWTMVSGSLNGQNIPADDAKNIKVILKDGKYTVKNGDNAVDEGTFEINAAKKPKTMDRVSGQNGETLLGIYELDGETIKICFAAPDKPRPQELSGKEGEGRQVYVFKRDKP